MNPSKGSLLYPQQRSCAQKLLYKHGRLILCVIKRCKWDMSVNRRNNGVGKENVRRVQCWADSEKPKVLGGHQVFLLGKWAGRLVALTHQSFMESTDRSSSRKVTPNLGDPKPGWPKKLFESLPGGEEPNQQPLHLVFKLLLPLPQSPN